jgi:hypothetical protein
MMDCLRSITRTLGVIAFLICALSLAGLSASWADPSTPSPSVHGDAPPCNSVCEAYLAWSSRVAATLHPSEPSKTTADPHRSPLQRVAHHVLRLRQRGLNSFAQLHVPNDDAAPSAAEPRHAAEIPPVPETPRTPEKAQAPETPDAVAVPRAAATPQAAETTHAVQAPASEVAPSRPIDQIAERFPALRAFMAARSAGTNAPTGDAAEQAFAALADSPAPQRRTATVNPPAPAPDRRWAASLVLVLCTLPALFVWWRASARRARDRARLMMFDAALRASGSPPR